ncbi:hypothetical protein KKC17_01335 [Patescibacteria group bacterium]|nr:hypothetical protein [Patescibacteria group bacterium]
MSSLPPKLPQELIKVIKQLKKLLPTAEIYLVGGAVRNLLLKRPTKDYDLLVKNIPADPLEKNLKKLGTTNLVGKNFGVFKWLPKNWSGELIDVALPRTEHSLNFSGHYRDFSVQSDANLTVEQDLARRDFTLNALALNLSTGKIIDPYNGQSDLNNKIIKTVGRANDRLQEDLSRGLRGLRLACQLNFTIEQTTLQAIKKIARSVANKQINKTYLVPRETIAKEFLKSLLANPIETINLYEKNGYLKLLLPEVQNLRACPQPPQFHSEGDVLTHTLLAFASLTSPAWTKYWPKQSPSLNLLLAILLHDLGKPLTLQTPQSHGTDRIRNHNHDIVGAKMIPGLIERLKLTSYQDPLAGQIETTVVTWLTANHLLLAHGRPQDFKPTTLYKYFLKNPDQGQLLLQLIFADTWATRPTNNLRLLDGFDELLKKIKQVRLSLPSGQLKLLLNGQDIMTKFKIKPGRQVGQLLKILEEAQVNGLIKNKKEALSYLKNHQSKNNKL